MNKYREPWDESNYKFTSPRDYYWRDCVRDAKFDAPYPRHEPLIEKIIGSIAFAGILILLMLL